MSDILQAAHAINERLVQLRRAIHQCPEVGRLLPHTKALVTQALQAYGLEPSPCGESGLVLDIVGDKPGRTFLLRADMDALPMREETGLPYASKNENMHACGHDCHAAMLTGAAKLLADRRKALPGTVRLLFQPAEETMEGALEMIGCGALENPRPDAAMMLHILSGLPVPSGAFCVFGGGVSYASVDWFRIDIQGKGGHGAQPHSAVSPLVILCAIGEHLQSLVPLTIDAADSAVVSLGEMHGGDIANVIPDTAYLAGTIRTFDPHVRRKLKAAMASSVPQLASAKGGTATVSFGAGAPCVVSDAAVAADVLASLQGMAGHEMAMDLGEAFGGAYRRVTSSEDFAYIAEQAPSAVVWLSAGTPEEGYVYPGHHPKVNFDDQYLYAGSAAYARCAIDWLQAHQ